MKNLENLAHELDSVLGLIGCRKSSLSDIQNNFILLVSDMNDKVHIGEEKYYFHEWHRELRILSELMYYNMKELEKYYEKAGEISRTLFSTVDKGGLKNE